MSPAVPGHVVRFGSFELDLSAGELRRRGVRLPLHGQPIQVLSILLENAGRVVTREELRKRIWPADTFVDFDHALNNSIAGLREVLGETAAKPRNIETIRRRGYRWVGPVNAEAPPVAAPLPQTVAPPAGASTTAAPAPAVGADRRKHALVVAVAAMVLIALASVLGILIRWRRQSAAVPQIRSIAVLPLENLSGDPAQEYFADGMTEALITDLGQIGALRVISRTSSMQYKSTHKPLAQIARELKVDAVVEGSVTRSSDRLRVTAQLVDAHNDRHLWAESYDRNLGDAVILQNQIAAAIASEVRAKLTPAEDAQLGRGRQVNPAAYEAYLKGRFHFNKRTETDLRTGIDYFNRAIAADPQYALAYVGLADSYNILGSMVFTAVARDDAKSKAMMFAAKALAIDDTLGEAHTSLADAKLLFDCDWKGSEAEFQRALALSPNYANAHHWYAELLIDSGRFEESISESYKAKQLDPLSAMIDSSLASRLCPAGRCDDALREALTALELDPSLPSAHANLADIYIQQGKFAEAIAENKDAVRLSSDNPNFVADLAYTYAVAGDRTRARRILSQLQQTSRTRYVAPYPVAVIYAALGDKRKALAALDQAYKEHSPWLNNLYRDSWKDGRLASLRMEPEFIRLLHLVGPPEMRQ